MPVRRPDGRAQIPWACGRSLLLHGGLVLVLPLCVIAAWWQVHRALTGNGLSWLYVFEWPAFAVIAVWFWWVLLTGPVGTAGPAPAPGPERETALLSRRTAPLRWDDHTETAALREYNAFLAELNAGRPASRPRRARATGGPR